MSSHLLTNTHLFTSTFCDRRTNHWLVTTNSRSRGKRPESIHANCSESNLNMKTWSMKSRKNNTTSTSIRYGARCKHRLASEPFCMRWQDNSSFYMETRTVITHISHVIALAVGYDSHCEGDQASFAYKKNKNKKY